MTRRILILIVITTMLGALLPAGAALASADATANLTSATGVYPGERSFTISVSNSEMLLVGDRINAVRIFLPVDQAGITLRDGPDGAPSAGTAPTGWTAEASRSGSYQFITYRGGSIAPGASTSFTIPANVLAPLGSDRTGTFGVQVSSDNFRTNRSAPAPAGGTLSATVRILEIIEGSVLPLQPYDAATDRGVRDGTGTAGQRITYGFDVRNHARGEATVAGSIAANNDLDRQVAADSRSVAAGATQSFRVPVDLGPITGSANRTVMFTAQAAASAATAPTRTSTFTVEVPVSLAFDGLDPTRTRSGEGSGRDFELAVTKSGAPAFDLTSSTLRFAGNGGAATDMPQTFAAGSPASATDLTYAFATISGSDGTHDATVDASGVDANLFSYTMTGVPVGSIVIDNLAPILDIVEVVLPTDADGDQQVAVKPSGDAVTVRGTIVGDDLVDDSLVVRLVPDTGSAVTLTTTREGSAPNYTFTASGDTDFDPSATNFKVTAEIRDTAGNIGTVAPSRSYVIDGVAPVLTDPARIIEPTMIRVRFADGTGLRGACDTSAWSLAGVPGGVSEVRLSDGTVCSGSGNTAARQLTPDGVRVLVLGSALDQDATPTLTYNGAAGTRLIARVPAKDGAGNDAARQTVQTVTSLVPDAPSILEVRRTNRYDGSSEDAYHDADEDRYYTAVGGGDGVEITVSGLRSNYRLRILDQNGRTLAERQFTGMLLPGQEGSMDINVPLPTADGVYARRAVFVTADDRIGLPSELSIALDTARPTIASQAFDGTDTVTVGFSEKIVAGSDFSDDWFSAERIQGEEGPGQQIRNVNAVEQVDARTRKLTVDLTDPSQFLRTFYWLQSGQRYEDRAGNRLDDTV